MSTSVRTATTADAGVVTRLPLYEGMGFTNRSGGDLMFVYERKL